MFKSIVLLGQALIRLRNLTFDGKMAKSQERFHVILHRLQSECN